MSLCRNIADQMRKSAFFFPSTPPLLFFKPAPQRARDAQLLTCVLIRKERKKALKILKVEGMDQACEEHPPPYDPQANGGIEIGVKLVKGHLKTLRSALEIRVGFKIPVAHPVVAWLVTHSSNILTWLSKGKDGRTAYHRVRGRPFNGKLLAFGESCRYKSRSHEQLHGRERWAEAIYLGRERKHGQHILFDGGSAAVAYARTVLRVPNAQKWKPTDIANVRVLPWSLHESRKPDVIFKDQVEKQEAPENPLRLFSSFIALKL